MRGLARPRTISDEAITQATREALRECGAGVTTAEIARRLGVSQPALFKRMGTREGLLVAALCPGPPVELERFLRTPPDPERDFAEAMAELLIQLHHVFEQVVPSLVWSRAAGLPMEKLVPAADQEDGPPPLRMRRQVTTWLKQAQRRGALRAGELTTLAEAAVGLVEARAFLEYIGGASTPAEPLPRWAKRMSKALLEGFAPTRTRK